MSTITSPLEAIKLTPLKPLLVFAHIEEKNRWSWWPFLLQMIGFAALIGLYFGLVDWPWYQQQHVLPALAGLSPSEQEVALQFSSRQNVLISSMIGLLLATPVINACYAFYLSKMTQLDEENIHTFGDWFGLTWWTNLPMLLTVAAGLIIFAISGSQASPTMVLAPFSCANILQLDAGSKWHQLASSISLLTLWVLWLQYQGVRAWTQLKPALSALIVTLPYIVVNGLWALFI